MIFDELIKLVSSNKAPDIRVDSRLVKAGDIFVAVEGAVYDGHDFIDQALANGAKYIVCQKNRTSIEYRPPRARSRGASSIETIFVDDSSKAAAILAQASMGNPSSKLTNLAVTGTNGKTTVAFLVRSCIQIADQKCGLIGTIVYDTGAASFEASLTTPDCLTIAEKQSQMLKAGSKYMVIEASSHALTQNRLAAIDFKAAAFTNLTGDHLDYHKTKKEYLAAKTKLFAALSPEAIAVLNKQSSEAELIAKHTKARILWYAIEEQADITARIESMDIGGTVFTLALASRSSLVPRPSSIVRTPLLGLHNVSNHLAAAGLCLAAGFDLETIAGGLSALQGVPGRLEKVGWDGDFTVLVDYAHTDDALKNVLSTLKPLCKGNLRVVFGCGGDRDRTKRPRMAKVVEQLADFVIVTSDNPRTEKPMDIINEIITGFENPGSPKVTIEPDRRKAIELVIKSAGKDDIVLIAGKGHENYQIIGKQKFPFSDKTIALECLAKRK
jgi:UDP-N-acetylmuramoyl-L-alanyl-D-glutamate--2,6-diaminopimelate ligase